MSVTQATVTSTQVAVRYRRNVGSLSIDMWTDTQPMCRSRCVVNIATDISVDMSTDCRPTYRSRGS